MRGQTKTEVCDKLRDLHSDIEAGIRKPQVVTVQRAADDWLANGLYGRSAATVRKNRYVPTAVLAAITSGTTLALGRNFREAGPEMLPLTVGHAAV